MWGFGGVPQAIVTDTELLRVAIPSYVTGCLAEVRGHMYTSDPMKPRKQAINNQQL